MIIPNHLQIEPVSGYCTSSCTMCTIKKLSREKLIMGFETFEHILKKFLPYREKMKFLSMTGMGESLIDKNLPKKIKKAKELGFNGVGFTTNATLLNNEKIQEILDAGLNTLICSIDGMKKETHELIRCGTDFDIVVNNIKNFIIIRNKLRKKTRIVIRFVRQRINKEEWPRFFDYWSNLINKEIGDEVVNFDVNNWAGNLKDYNSIDINSSKLIENYVCEDPFERMWIYANGEVSLCCGDADGFFKMGNLIDNNPLEIYNNKIFSRYRKAMLKGELLQLKHCKECTVPRSRELRKK